MHEPHPAAVSYFVPIRLLLRDLSALRQVCLKRGWELRPRQICTTFGHRDYGIAIPGRQHEISLLDQGDQHRLAFDADTDLGCLLGPETGLLWQAYAGEKVRLEAARRGQPCNRLVDGQGTWRFRLQGGSSRQVAHLTVSRTGACTLRTFTRQGWEEFFYLAHALGKPCFESLCVEAT